MLWRSAVRYSGPPNHNLIYFFLGLFCTIGAEGEARLGYECVFYFAQRLLF
jgi:hypothetical protein